MLLYVVVAPEQSPEVTPVSPSSLRWGKGQGCDFITQSAAAWSARYFCSKKGELGCSYDNR
jgi:hypothetical protein